MIDHSEIRMVQKTLGQPYDDETVRELFEQYAEEVGEYFDEVHVELMEQWWKDHPEVRHGMQTPECTMETWTKAQEMSREWALEDFVNGPLREYYAKHPEPFAGEEDDRWVTDDDDEEDDNDPDNWAREEQQSLF